MRARGDFSGGTGNPGSCQRARAVASSRRHHLSDDTMPRSHGELLLPENRVPVEIPRDRLEHRVWYHAGGQGLCNVVLGLRLPVSQRQSICSRT